MHKKSLLIRRLPCVWRSGRDSNSRPHAWQACILTKLNYRTVCIIMLKTSLFFLKCGCKSTTFFSFNKEKNSIFPKIIRNRLFHKLLKSKLFYPSYLEHPRKTVPEYMFFGKFQGFGDNDFAVKNSSDNSPQGQNLWDYLLPQNDNMSAKTDSRIPSSHHWAMGIVLLV